MNEALMAVLPAAVKKVNAKGPASYYEELVRNNFSPGWARPEPSIWPAPKKNFEPTVWRYQQAKQALDEAGGYVPMELTERRNLLMVNPVQGNLYASVRNLVAAYQMIQPGETADDHRHTPHALRLIVEATPPVYTVVDGVRIDMEPGDVVLTPGWRWHGHANESSKRAYWIDFLDVPLVQHLESMFFEKYEQGFRPPERAEPDSPLRFHTRQILDEQGTASATEPMTIPIDASSLPAMALDYVVLPAGATVGPTREAANNLYSVISGSARFSFDGSEEVVGRGDVVSVPLWTRHEIRGDEHTVLFNVSDRPLHEFLRCYRVEHGAD